MKKMIAFLLVGFSVFALTACGKDEAPADEDKITITFPQDVDGKKTIELYEQFDIKTGVVAVDSEGSSYGSVLTATIDTENADLLDGSMFSGLRAGEFEITYTVDFIGKTGTAKRTIKVNEGAEIGENLNLHPTFVEGEEDGTILGWGIYNEGGASFIPQSDGSILVENQTCPGQAHQVRLNTETFTVVKGQAYQVTFDAKSTIARDIQVQVGQTLEADPWFYQAAPDMTVSLTQTMSRKAVTFTAAETNSAMDLDQVCLLIGMGAVGSAINSNITIANVSIHTYGGAVADTVKPIVTQDIKTVYTNTNKEYSKNEIIEEFFAISDDVTAFDDLDITLTITDPSNASQETLNSEVKGTWKLSLSVYDEAGNKADSPIYNVVVRDRVLNIENYLTMKVDTFAPSGSDEAYSKANPNLAVFWAEGGAINKQEGTTMTEDSLVIEYAVAWAWYDPQFFLTTQEIDTTGTYTVTLDVTNVTTDSRAAGIDSRNIQVGGQNITVVNGETETVTFEVEITEGSAYTLVILFNWLDAGVSTDTTGVNDGTVKELLKIENMSMTLNK